MTPSWIALMFSWVCAANGTVFTAFEETPSARSSLASLQLRAAMIRDSRYTLWPDSTSIPYRLDPAYTANEKITIITAMNQINIDMSGCIGFVPFNNDSMAGDDHLVIFKTMNDGSTPLVCFSFPGRTASQSGRGQKLGMFSGTNGCLGSVREAMKYLVHALGLRNEYDRPDREKFIMVMTQNLRPAYDVLMSWDGNSHEVKLCLTFNESPKPDFTELLTANLANIYSANSVDYLNTDFDYNSITMPNPTKYAKPGTSFLLSKLPGRSLGNLARLSLGDCQALALLYSSCRVLSCGDPYAQFTAITTAAPTVAIVTTTAQSVSVTSSSGVIDPGFIDRAAPAPAPLGPVEPVGAFF